MKPASKTNYYSDKMIFLLLKSQKQLVNRNQFSVLFTQKSKILEKKLIEVSKKQEVAHQEVQQKLKNKKEKIKVLKSSLLNLETENDKLKQIIQFYQNQNRFGLTNIQIPQINDIETQLLALQDNLKIQKAKILIRQELQLNDNNQQFLEDLTQHIENQMSFLPKKDDHGFQQTFFQNSLQAELQLEQSQSQSQNAISFQNYFNKKNHENIHRMLDISEVDYLDKKLTDLTSQNTHLAETQNNINNSNHVQSPLNTMETEFTVCTQEFKQPITHFDSEEKENYLYMK